MDKTPILEDILVNGKTLKRYDNTMIVADLKLNLKSGNSIELPFGYIEPVIVQDSFIKGHYDTYSNMYYGDGAVEFSFIIDENIESKSIKIRYDNPSYYIKQFIWDCNSSIWEEKELSNFVIYEGEIEKYVSEKNEIRLRFDIKDDGYGISLPQISVKGSVK